jgi:hypothetical protein
MAGFDDWIGNASLWLVALVLLGCMCAATVAGVALNRVRGIPAGESQDGEEYIVSAVLGLLALLMGFTFSLAVDRFETRRQLVLAEANAVATAYLRAQLLPEPHRARASDILHRYADNRLALATAAVGEQSALLATNDRLTVDLWAATSAAFPAIQGLDFSSAYLDSINQVIDLDAARKAARLVRVPRAIFTVLFVYLITTAAVLGYVLRGSRGRLAVGFLMALLTLSLILILDIDRPTMGRITEGQWPMEALTRHLATTPPSTYDRWRTPPSP